MLKTWKDGQKVTGMFGGRVRYSGRIQNSRWTPDGRGTIFTVELDEPIDSFGWSLNRIEIHQGWMNLGTGDTIESQCS